MTDWPPTTKPFFQYLSLRISDKRHKRHKCHQLLRNHGLVNFQSAATEAIDGFSYGLSIRGGEFKCGSIFRVSPTTGVEILKSFECGYGVARTGIILEESPGQFLGVATFFGASESGSVFRFSVSENGTGGSTGGTTGSGGAGNTNASSGAGGAGGGLSFLALILIGIKRFFRWNSLSTIHKLAQWKHH